MSKKLPNPKKQTGKIKYFRRRKPQDSLLKENSNLNKLYNFIRMLDVSEKNFPKAYFKIGKRNMSFLTQEKKEKQ